MENTDSRIYTLFGSVQRRRQRQNMKVAPALTWKLSHRTGNQLRGRSARVKNAERTNLRST